MKRFLLLTLLLFTSALFAQTTVDFDTTGQNFTWTVFANGTGAPTDFEIIPNPNPNPAGINTSPTVAKFKVNADAAVFAGAFTDDLGSFVITLDNAMPTIMVHKDVISDCAFKIEGPNGLNREVKVPNTVIGQWEKLTFDFTVEIGKEVTRIVFFPDFPANRTAGSMNYFDNIEFLTLGAATINFDPVGQGYSWYVFANGTGDPTDFAIIPNPNPSGINTSPSVAKFKVNVDAAVFAGVYTESMGSFIVTTENAMPTIMVHKEVISDCAFKIEGPNGLNREIKVPNTIIGQWEKLTFDFSAEIGKEVRRIVFFPDFPGTRTAGSMNYFDNIEFVQPPAPARVQIIHNSADILAGAVDIYVNGALALDDFAFRAATPFIDLPSEVTLNIGVAPGNSTSVSDTLANFPVVLAEGEKYVVIANGLLTGGYLPNPDGRNTNFTLLVKTMAQEVGTGSGVDLFVLHGSTDAPTVDVKAREAGNLVLVNDAAYSDITPYFTVPAGNYTLDLYLADGTTLVNSFIAPLAGLGGGAAAVFASGFLNPAGNQNGAAFGLFAALANGTVVQLVPGVVPVELTSFTGAFVGNDVQLKWATATELNNRGFEIQRSISGSAFATIAFVEGFGTTTEQKQYTFTDRNVTASVDHAYRLKQIDFNGAYEYSVVVNVGSTLPVDFALEQNYPNPFNPTTNIIYSVPVKSNVTLDVYNLIGQKVVTLFEGEVEAGKHTAQFNATSMSSGIYLFKLTAVGENGSQFSSSKKMTLLK